MPIYGQSAEGTDWGTFISGRRSRFEIWVGVERRDGDHEVIMGSKVDGEGTN